MFLRYKNNVFGSQELCFYKKQVLFLSFKS